MCSGNMFLKRIPRIHLKICFMKERIYIMKIKDILAEGRPTLSFEVFPPKTADAYESVEKAASKIAQLKPDFRSVPYGKCSGAKGGYPAGWENTGSLSLCF